jgi:hypothetical protein
MVAQATEPFGCSNFLGERMAVAWGRVTHAVNISQAGYEFEGGTRPIA